MKLNDLLESVTFGVVKYNEEKGYYSGEYEEIERDCIACDGSGQWDEERECPYCKGTKKETSSESIHPELNVSNHNAYTIVQDLLGENPNTEDGLCGIIKNKDLPDIRRRLIRIKNGDTSNLTEPSREEGGNTIMDKSGEIPTIRKTATIYHGGRTDAQVMRYIDQLLSIIDVAQKENADVSWN